MTKLVIEDDQLRGVALAGGRTVERTAVFDRPGNVPHNDGLVTALGCDKNDAGFVTVGTRLSTHRRRSVGNVISTRTAQPSRSTVAAAAGHYPITGDP